MTPLQDIRLEVLIDMTRTTEGRGRMAGAVRVESEFAASLLRTHPGLVVPISWSSLDEAFVELSPESAWRFLSPNQESYGEVSGPPLDATRRPDPGCRRVLLVTGAGWLSNLKLLHALVHTRHVIGAELQVVVHDLVHLQFPQWSPRQEALKCGSAHEAILAGADRLLVYSDSTAWDIADAAARRGIAIGEIARMALGTAFVPEPGSDDRGSVGLDSLADRPFVLYVSTIAARKNHGFIAQVWRRLAAELGTRLPRLLLVGRVAADQEAMMERLGRDPGLADHVIHITGADDAQLAWLYRHCLFTVFPSLYEGWGLPVAESLALGKVCLASNASSIPEAAAGATPLLDPLDIGAWCDAVRTMSLEPRVLEDAEKKVRASYQPTTWSEASRRLWDAIMPPVTPVRERPMLVVTPDSSAQRLAPLVTAHEPWQPIRTPLGVVAGHVVRYALGLDRVPPHGVRLDLSARSEERAPIRVEIEINGSALDGCELQPGETSVRRFDLSRDLLLGRGLLEIVARAFPRDETTPEGPPALVLDTLSASPLTQAEEERAIAARREIWRMDEVFHFSAGSRHLAVLKNGWDEPARWGVWTVAPEAALTFRPMPPPSAPIVVRAVVRGFVPQAQPALDVAVSVNGVEVTTWTFRHPSDFSLVERSVVIPPDLIVDGFVYLTLAIPDSRSPRQLGMSEDDRRLGVGLARARCSVLTGARRGAEKL